MSSTKLVAVYGATGSQGGSVIQSLLKNKANTFTLRGVTRNLDSDKAKALAAQGVYMVQADGFEKDQMVAAFQGSWAAFVNTNSDDPVRFGMLDKHECEITDISQAVNQPEGPNEAQLGKLIVDAAAEAGVKHLIYSGMASATTTTNGAVPCAAFDREFANTARTKHLPIKESKMNEITDKNAVGQYAVDKGAFDTVNIVSAGWYLENHLVDAIAPVMGGWPTIPDDEGYLTLRCPRWGGNDKIPMIAMGNDWGDLVHGILLQPEKYNGKMVHGMSQDVTPTELVQAFEKVTGKKSRYVPIEDWRTFETYGDGGLETVKYMFGFCQQSGGRYFGVLNDVAPARELKKLAEEAKGGRASLTTIEEFFAQYFAQ